MLKQFDRGYPFCLGAVLLFCLLNQNIGFIHLLLGESNPSYYYDHSNFFSMLLGGGLSLILPFFSLALHKEWWLTRALSQHELHKLAWASFLKWWLVVLSLFSVLNLVTYRYPSYFAQVFDSFLYIPLFVAFHGSAFFVGNSNTRKQQFLQWLVLAVTVAISGVLFSDHQAKVFLVLGGLSCFVTAFTLSRVPSDFYEDKKSVDVAQVLYAPLWSKILFKLPVNLKPYWVVVQRSYLQYLSLSLLLALFFMFVHKTHRLLTVYYLTQPGYDHLLSFFSPQLLHPWMMVAGILCCIPSALLWRSQKEFILTRSMSYSQVAVSNWFIQGAILIGLMLMMTILSIGALGLMPRWPLFAIVLFCWIAGPVSVLASFSLSGLSGEIPFGTCSAILTQLSLGTVLLWACAILWRINAFRRARIHKAFYVVYAFLLVGSSYLVIASTPLLHLSRQSNILSSDISNEKTLQENLWFGKEFQEKISGSLFSFDPMRGHYDHVQLTKALQVSKKDGGGGVEVAKMSLEAFKYPNKYATGYANSTSGYMKYAERKRLVALLSYWLQFSGASEKQVDKEQSDIVRSFLPFIQKDYALALKQARQVFQRSSSLEAGLSLAYMQDAFYLQAHNHRLYQQLLSLYPEQAGKIYKQMRLSALTLSDFEHARSYEQKAMEQGEVIERGIILTRVVSDLNYGKRNWKLTKRRWPTMHKRQQFIVAGRRLLNASDVGPVLKELKALMNQAAFEKLIKLNQEKTKFQQELLIKGLSHTFSRYQLMHFQRIWRLQGLHGFDKKDYPLLVQFLSLNF